MKNNVVYNVLSKNSLNKIKEQISEEVILKEIEQSPFWSSKCELKGSRFGTGYRFKLYNFYKNWVIEKPINRCSPYIFNLETKERIFLDNLKLYALIKNFHNYKNIIL